MAHRTPRRSCKSGRATALALFLVTGFAVAQPATDFDVGRQAWRASRYSTAVLHLLAFREQPFGRTAEVDYMIGTSACRIPSKRDWGLRILNWVLTNYSLDIASRELVQREYSQCSTTEKLPPASARPLGDLIALQAPGARGSGKMYALGLNVVAHRPARQLRPLREEEGRQRRVPLTQTARIEDVVAKVSRLPHVTVCHGFAIATDQDFPAQTLTRTCDALSSFVKFVQRQYAAELPSVFTTLYLLSNQREMRRVAERVHYLELGPQTLGYTIHDDLSVVAWSPELALGTVQHELFHLLVRGNFGDIPQWLDEGLAAVYEVSARCGDDYFGETNWRAKVIDELGLTPLAQVVTTTAYPFDEPATYEAPVTHGSASGDYARDMATARYFALWLQETGQLGRVFASFRDRAPAEIEAPASNAIALVERTLQRPVDEVQREFEAWYHTRGEQLRYSGGRCQNATPWPPAAPPAAGLLAASFRQEPLDPSSGETLGATALPFAPAPAAHPPRRGCACRMHASAPGVVSLMAALAVLAAFSLRRRLGGQESALALWSRTSSGTADATSSPASRKTGR